MNKALESKTSKFQNSLWVVIWVLFGLHAVIAGWKLTSVVIYHGLASINYQHALVTCIMIALISLQLGFKRSGRIPFLMNQAVSLMIFSFGLLSANPEVKIDPEQASLVVYTVLVGAFNLSFLITWYRYDLDSEDSKEVASHKHMTSNEAREKSWVG